MTFVFYNGLTKGSEVRFMRKILLVDDNSAIAQELAKLLKRRGYGVQIAATVAGAKEVIEKESPLFICSDLDLPDGSGLELLDMVRAADADIPFLIAYCHDPSHYEAEAVRRGVTLCLDKTRINFVADKLIEYAYRQSCGEAQPDFHKLLYVHADTADTSNGLRSGVLSEAMLQKGFYIVTAETLASANDLLLEDDNIELILCDTTLPDGSGLDLLHSQRILAERYGTLVKSRPLFILTDSKDLATEYQDFASTGSDHYEIVNPYASDMTGKSGSYHALIPNAPKAWGLPVKGCAASEPQRILDALSSGKLVVAIMTKGHFTSGGHFIVLRGVKDGQVLVADPASYKRSEKSWDLSIILNEASKRAGAGGPFWIIG